MLFVNYVSSVVAFVLKRSLLALPFLLLIYLVFGINYEHGGTNAGSMYPLVWVIPGLTVSIISFISFFITDKLTLGSKLNFIKNFVHLFLGISLLWIGNKFFTVIAITLPAVAVINLIVVSHYFY
jgi:hypothetical protein